MMNQLPKQPINILSEKVTSMKTGYFLAKWTSVTLGEELQASILTTIFI